MVHFVGNVATLISSHCALPLIALYYLSEQEYLDSGIEIVRLPCSSLTNGRLPIPKRSRAYKKLLAMLLQENFDAVFINGRYYAHSI